MSTHLLTFVEKVIILYLCGYNIGNKREEYYAKAYTKRS
jgi:hypothetical protein